MARVGTLPAETRNTATCFDQTGRPLLFPFHKCCALALIDGKAGMSFFKLRKTQRFSYNLNTLKRIYSANFFRFISKPGSSPWLEEKLLLLSQVLGGDGIIDHLWHLRGSEVARSWGKSLIFSLISDISLGCKFAKTANKKKAIKFLAISSKKLGCVSSINTFQTPRTGDDCKNVEVQIMIYNFTTSQSAMHFSCTNWYHLSTNICCRCRHLCNVCAWILLMLSF